MLIFKWSGIMEIEDWKNKYEEKLKNFDFIFEKEEDDDSRITLYYKNIRDSGIFKNFNIQVFEKKNDPEKKIYADLYIKRNPLYNDKYEFFTEVTQLFDYLEYFEISDKENEDDKFKIRDLWDWYTCLINMHYIFLISFK